VTPTPNDAAAQPKGFLDAGGNLVEAPILGARTVGQLLGALAVEETTVPAEIVRALDDESAIPVGYPERD
jgi:aryl-alcohol dehydrogenase-like predicted oxidoreductase